MDGYEILVRIFVYLGTIIHEGDIDKYIINRKRGKVEIERKL